MVESNYFRRDIETINYSYRVHVLVYDSSKKFLLLDKVGDFCEVYNDFPLINETSIQCVMGIVYKFLKIKITLDMIKKVKCCDYGDEYFIVDIKSKFADLRINMVDGKGCYFIKQGRKWKPYFYDERDYAVFKNIFVHRRRRRSNDFLHKSDLKIRKGYFLRDRKKINYFVNG